MSSFSTIVVSAKTAAALITAADAALAALANTTRLRSVSYLVPDEVRKLGLEHKLIVDYDTSGVVMANAWQINIFERSTIDAAVSAAGTFSTDNPAYFVSPVFLQYLPHSRRTKPAVALTVYNQDGTNGETNWMALGGGSPPVGAAGGDLAGTYPHPTVDGIQGKAAPAPAVGGTRLIYDITTDALVWYSTQTYTTLALAAADQANQIIGERVIIYNAGGGTAEDGTYQLTTKTGTVGDYTKISDATETAAEVGIVDAGGYYSSTDVEGALQELGAGTAGSIDSSGLMLGPTTVDAVDFARYASVVWEITCIRTDITNQRYVETVLVTHDSVNAYSQSQGVAVVPAAAGLVSTTFDISGTDLRARVTFSAGTWDVRVRRIALAAN